MNSYTKVLGALFLVTAIKCNAQSEKYVLSAGGGLGYQSPTVSSAFGYLEGMFPTHKKWRMSLKSEVNILSYQYLPTGIYNTQSAMSGSLTFTFRHFLGEKTFKPFYGFGTGLYLIRADHQNIITGKTTAVIAYRPGIYPTLGIFVNRFIASIDINLVPTVKFQDGTRVATSYLALHAGVMFGRRNHAY